MNAHTRAGGQIKMKGNTKIAKRENKIRVAAPLYTLSLLYTEQLRRYAAQWALTHPPPPYTEWLMTKEKKNWYLRQKEKHPPRKKSVIKIIICYMKIK